MFDPNPTKILEIFSASNKLAVPKYQRNFAWGRNEAQELVEDVRAKCSDPNFNLFLGTVIFDVSKRREEGEIQIIDGQQRITTASILLIACRQAAKKRDPVFANSIQNRIAFDNPYTGRHEGNRLLVSPSISAAYDVMASDDWGGSFPERSGGRSIKRQVNKLKPLYEYFFNEVKDLQEEELRQFVASLYDAYFISIDIENTSQAFDIFERMNARGIPLDVADLLKNHLFANSDIEDIEERWVKIVENSGSTPLRMLKYFWVTKVGYVKKSELYRGIREYSRTYGTDQLVQELEDFSYFYNVVRDGEEENVSDYLNEIGITEITSNESYIESFSSSLEALRLFRITQIYPVLYAAINSYKRQDRRNPKDLLSLVDLLEKYHFINNVICERVGNEVEKLYTEYARDFTSGEFKPLLTSLTKDLKSRLANREEFLSNFGSLTYASDSIALICYIFDRINNGVVNARGGQRARLYYPNSSVQKKNYNIEHLLPQKQKSTQNLDRETVEAIDSIGNLFVISRHTNSDLGSLQPIEKIKLIQSRPEYTNNIPYLAKFVSGFDVKKGSWGKEEIINRSRDLGETGYDTVWSIK